MRVWLGRVVVVVMP
ncbi:hypothetical protein EE612_040669 [Oryza sativa]|nr:hypothetical protein EE612_040669 [Oryza sativa]KAB8106357.1 hypothetical protein EE612_040669 [Oryza sativa]